MSRKGMNRRQFVQTSGLATAGAVVVATGAATLASKDAWAAQMSALGAHVAKTILAMTRATYPHETLDDIYYMKVVEDLDGAAAGDAGLAKLLDDGVAELDGAMGVKFVDLSEGNRLALLRSMADSAFFQKVRGTCVVSIYNQPLVWRHFGYEGPSSEFGGYIDRGFQDLRWLPDPPADASPEPGAE